MNVSCTACPAKYAVPDDRVRGKKARITCKRCGTVIVIDGTTTDGGRGAEAAPPSSSPPAPSVPASVPAATLTPTSTAPAAEWLVAITDDHQEPATLERIVELYSEGRIDGETFIWRDGMPEWRTPFEVPEVAAALRARGLEHRIFESGPPSSNKELYPDEEATNIARPAAQAAALRVPRLHDDTLGDEDRTVFRKSAPAASSSPLSSEPLAEAGPEVAVNPSAALDLGPPPPIDEEPTIARSSPFAGLDSFPPEADEAQGSKPPSLSPRAESTSVSELAARAFERATSSEPPPDSRPSLLGRSRPSVVGEAGPSSRRRAVRSSQALSARLGGSSELGPLSVGSRAERRPRSGDLFARQAEAGGENDPALRPSQPPNSQPPSSQPSDATHPEAGQGSRLTGARNETSVLFTLDALVQAEKAPSAKPASPREMEAELLLGTATPPSAIANLGSTGVATLVAPDLMAPVRSVPDPAEMFPGEYAPRRRSPLLIGGLLIVAAGVGAGAALVLPDLLSSKDAAAPTASAAAPSAPVSAAAPQPEASAPSAPPSASASAEEEPSSTPSTAPATARPERPERAVPPAAAAPPAPAARPAPPDEATSAEGGTPKPTPASPAAQLPKPAEPAAAEAPPFDQAAAKATLMTAASHAASCKQPGGPTGTGRALVTFAPSGRVTKAEVTGDFAGTPVGSCVARIFRNAKVPAFSGDAVTVAKSFSID
ncbi:MAG: zinc-ribbon domain-containing protein [Pseudomonadota bacterium]